MPAGVECRHACSVSIALPATDEKPFFFHLEPGTPAGLRWLLLLAVAMLVAAWIVPAVVRRGKPGTAAPTPRLGGYFVLLGAAFLMVEVLVLQRTIRSVGLPTLNLGLVLATFLVAAGCGSSASARIRDRRTLRVVLLFLGVALAMLMPLLGSLPAVLDRLPLGWRCAALVLVLFPFAFAMGMPFPSGIRMLPETARPWVPWFWGLNGVASIGGSALVVAVVLQRGFWITGLLPAALYLVAAIAAGCSSRACAEPQWNEERLQALRRLGLLLRHRAGARPRPRSVAGRPLARANMAPSTSSRSARRRRRRAVETSRRASALGEDAAQPLDVRRRTPRCWRASATRVAMSDANMPHMRPSRSPCHSSAHCSSFRPVVGTRLDRRRASRKTRR